MTDSPTHSTTVDDAKVLLDALNLPEDCPQILRQPRYWNVAFCRLYLERCEDLRLEDPQAGLAAAEVVPQLAYFVPRHQCGGEQGWSSLQVLALGVVGSAHRAVSELSTAESVFNLAILLFADDADADARGDLLRRTAYLRAAQERFDEAENLVNEAVDIFAARNDDQALGRTLCDRGTFYLLVDKLKSAARDFTHALDLLDAERSPRHYYAAVHNLADAISRSPELDAGEAVPWLNKALALNAEPEASVSRMKLRWTQARLDARRGERTRACSQLDAIRQRLRASGAVFDYALASVELAELYFEDGCTTRVREIVGELFPVFQHLKNDRETRVALRLFQRACMAEALSEHLFRDVKRVLVRRSAF